MHSAPFLGSLSSHRRQLTQEDGEGVEDSSDHDGSSSSSSDSREDADADEDAGAVRLHVKHSFNLHPGVSF